MKRLQLFLTIPLLGLSACNMEHSDSQQESASKEGAAPATAIADDDPLLSHDPREGEAMRVDIADAEARPIMQLQVVLDRLGFTPGVLDDKIGISTRNAISGFQEANNLEITGQADSATMQALERWNNIPATRVVTIPADFAQDRYQQIPDDAAGKARLKRLDYESLDEKLAERFHTTVAMLKLLNPGGIPAGMKSETQPRPDASPLPAATPTGSGAAGETLFFRAGQQIRVPNIGADKIVASSVSDADWLATLRNLGVGTEQPAAAKIVVSKSKGTLKVFDREQKLVGVYTATMGSRHDPLPLGQWKVLGIAHNPPFTFDPELFWDVPDSHAKQVLPPGPNGPVGVVWIDLSKEHYGIHGTPDPESIGRAQSHGCVRLTNWDAARLAQMVSTKTQVLFEA